MSPGAGWFVGDESNHDFGMIEAARYTSSEHWARRAGLANDRSLYAFAEGDPNGMAGPSRSPGLLEW